MNKAMEADDDGPATEEAHDEQMEFIVRRDADGDYIEIET